LAFEVGFLAAARAEDLGFLAVGFVDGFDALPGFFVAMAGAEGGIETMGGRMRIG
jgi:hypothetical protein